MSYFKLSKRTSGTPASSYLKKMVDISSSCNAVVLYCLFGRISRLVASKR